MFAREERRAFPSCIHRDGPGLGASRHAIQHPDEAGDGSPCEDCAIGALEFNVDHELAEHGGDVPVHIPAMEDVLLRGIGHN